MRDAEEGWKKIVAEGIASYREVLRNLQEGRDVHNGRNGLSDEDYVRPGLSVEIPLFWSTF